MNFYSDYASIGWELLEIGDENLDYEFDILAFWKTPDGRVFSASDSGCSCPTPFENYENEAELERVGSLAQAEQIIDSWNKPEWSLHPKADAMKLKESLRAWF